MVIPKEDFKIRKKYWDKCVRSQGGYIEGDEGAVGWGRLHTHAHIYIKFKLIFYMFLCFCGQMPDISCNLENFIHTHSHMCVCMSLQERNIHS